MAENNFFKLLEDAFPKTDKELWKKTAIKELNGNEPFTHLKWKDSDQLEFYPYYDKEDIKNLVFYQNFNQKPAKHSFLGNRSWFNTPCVLVTAEVTANSLALEHLINGADGILFDLSQIDLVDLRKLLAQIEWEYCLLSFRGIKPAFIETISSYLKDFGIKKDEMQGNIFWDEVPQTRIPDSLRPFSKIRPLGYHVATSTAVKEIHDALVFGTTVLNAATQLNLNPQDICFSVNADSNLLNQVSKIRALRFLWFQLVQVYEYKNFDPADLHIHVRSEAWINKSFQPHGNLLKATTATMAGIIGGGDSITVFPEDESNKTMNRIARNVSSILREESNFDKVSDPLAGSYAVEIMTDQIAQNAWSLFQKTMMNK
jgi:methylmalonyl-CoA mutase